MDVSVAARLVCDLLDIPHLAVAFDPLMLWEASDSVSKQVSFG